MALQREVLDLRRIMHIASLSNFAIGGNAGDVCAPAACRALLAV
jgi:hypothetical protein